MKLDGILGSFKATGSIGKVVTAQVIMGRQIIRKWFKPFNPKTQSQKAIRDVFLEAVTEYKNLTPAQKEPWQEQAKNKKTIPTALYYAWYLKNYWGLAYLGVGRLGGARLNREEI